MRIIEITKDKVSREEIDIIQTNDIIVVYLNFSALTNLKDLGFESSNVIYLALGEKEVYVGQTDNILKRFEIHSNVSSEWCTKLIFLTNREKSIGKDMQDYMERYLIEQFKKNSNRTVKNTNSGNSSSIDIDRKIKSNNLLAEFDYVLQTLNINLYQLEVKADEDVDVAVNAVGEYEIELWKESFNLSAGKQVDVFLDFINKIAKKHPSFILEQIFTGKATYSQIFGTEEDISPAGTKQSKPFYINKTKYWVYTNLSQNGKFVKMNELKDEVLRYEKTNSVPV
jgi:negative regulator of replication initiation